MCHETPDTDDACKQGCALVTGAGSGIGRAIAISLSDARWPVVLMGRRRDCLESTAQAMPADAAICVGDVRSRQDVATAIEAAESMGRLSLLVNNAGIMPIAPAVTACLDDWKDTIDVNVHGVLNTIAAALPLMRSHGSGHIVNISSVAGRAAFPAATVYSASKAALDMISEGVRGELSAAHLKNGPAIRVTSIAPGAVSTELPNSIRDPEVRAGTEAYYSSMSHPLTPEDVARAVQFAVDSPPHVNINEIVIRPVEMSR
ncbi:MAG: SDR family oxidoreductase [Pirellulaceae bacterium]|jgi:NADP-dependent 3-hydroxy acid dehydrogenase YdfG|nr:SDR family oxidoreductase [Pirellulaceae bacterium]HJO16024.1 SDR family oxidoreductase [Phycisphaerales bacterium]